MHCVTPLMICDVGFAAIASKQHHKSIAFFAFLGSDAAAARLDLDAAVYLATP